MARAWPCCHLAVTLLSPPVASAVTQGRSALCAQGRGNVGAHQVPVGPCCPSRWERVAALTAATWPPRVTPPKSHPVIPFGNVLLRGAELCANGLKEHSCAFGVVLEGAAGRGARSDRCCRDPMQGMWGLCMGCVLPFVAPRGVDICCVRDPTASLWLQESLQRWWSTA